MFVSGPHDPNLKGNVAELKIAAEAARLGVNVFSPMTEHGRADLVFDVGGGLLRIQCKWACVRGDVVQITTGSNRLTPAGYVRSTYTADEVDAVAVYCGDLDRYFLLPITVVAGKQQVLLRLAPPRNGQRACLNWATEYELAGAIAQLGERRTGSAKVAGSSPASSTPSSDVLGAHEFREHFGWYMERAAAGESFLITRRGKPYARLSPPHEQLDLPAPEPAEVVPITTAKERTA